jgi:hypothetical protein
VLLQYARDRRAANSMSHFLQPIATIPRCHATHRCPAPRCTRPPPALSGRAPSPLHAVLCPSVAAGVPGRRTPSCGAAGAPSFFNANPATSSGFRQRTFDRHEQDLCRFPRAVGCPTR